MGDIQEVLGRLPRLTPSELAQVQQRLALLGVNKTEEVSEDWLLQGITIELRRRGIWTGSGPIPRRLIPPQNNTNSEKARDNLLAGVRLKLRNAEQLALGALAGGALAELLLRRKVPVTPGTVLKSIEQLGSALEDAFPGYWGSAALGVCLRLV